jgi:hypothetical protein
MIVPGAQLRHSNRIVVGSMPNCRYSAAFRSTSASAYLSSSKVSLVLTVTLTPRSFAGRT